MTDIIYIVSVVFSLYAVYLYLFKTYKQDYDGTHEERIVHYNITYIIAFAAAFFPFFNTVLWVSLLAFGLNSMDQEDIYIDSWLFRKQNNKKED